MSKKPHRQKVLVILGPTASGKSDLAVELARRFNGEVVSADSRQIYKGLDIGSGKITKKEMRGVPHHCLDIASPKRTFTVAQYQKHAECAIQQIVEKGKLPIVCGGTGFYIDALIYRYEFPNAKPDPKLRKKLGEKTAAELFEQLQKLDPDRAAGIDRRNKRRLVRALEIVSQLGKPVPSLSQRQYSNILQNIGTLSVLKIGVKLPDTILKNRIKKRLHARLKKGMVAEVRKLRSGGISWRRLDQLGLEYRYVSRHLRGLITRNEMTETLKKEIWRYAKRQMTWFRRDPEVAWVKGGKEALELTRRQLAS